MQWRRQRRVTHVIGSSNHVLLLARYQDAPPGEDDEEEGLCNGYVKNQENDTSGRTLDRNGQSGYKPRRTTSGSSSVGNYGSNSTRSHKEESSGSSSQPKIIFNEDEYTRITTPRQDVLFKKGYLSRKKPWASNASTSATPSTTESQSASHSTADGSETTEDQQLLDRDSGAGEYPPAVKPGTQLGYGTFYDHSSGYYYEYPVMLVGPAPVPAQVGPSVLAAVPCGHVPLRPIEWINPAFVPKLSGQPFCLMGYESGQNAEGTTVTEEPESELLAIENSNGTCNESGTGSVSCSGSVVCETEEQTEETNPMKEQQVDEHPTEEQNLEDHYKVEQYIEEQILENGMNGAPYFEPVLMQQPVHVSHVIPAVPQPYMYPGHFMFGPPLVNVNGITIQSGPMIRTTDIAAMTAACAKRRKKKKKRKQKRPALGNTEDEEEGEYSSECDSGLPSSRLSWTACTTSTTNTTTTTNLPLNPECQEFQLHTVVEPHTSLALASTSNDTTVPEENSAINEPNTLSIDAAVSVNGSNEECSRDDSEKSTNQKIELTTFNSTDFVGNSSAEDSQSMTLKISSQDKETNKLKDFLDEKGEALSSTNEVTEITNGARTEDEAPPAININEIINDLVSGNETCEMPTNETSVINIISEACSELSDGSFVNGKTDSDSYIDELQTSNISIAVITSNPSSPQNDDRSHENMHLRSSTSITISTKAAIDNEDNEQAQQSYESANNKAISAVSSRKYNAKESNVARESTPDSDLRNVTSANADLDNEKDAIRDITEDLESMNLSNGSCSKPDSVSMLENSDERNDGRSSNFMSEVCNHCEKVKIVNDEGTEVSNEDSGFESQTRLSHYPITEAVTEWLRKANSPDIFITSVISSDSETEDEDDVDENPPKNLQSNPMPALSANSRADNVGLSDTTNCSEFAIANIKNDQVDNNGASAISRKRRDTKGTKKKSGERTNRRMWHVDPKIQNEVVSSSDSCGQQEDSINTARRKNQLKQDVGNICELTEKDSVAGMRVASSSRMDSRRVNARRTKRLGKCNRGPIENLDMKIKRIEDVDTENDDEGIVKDAVNIRTFEKGEIIVTEDGKLLTTSTYEPVLRDSYETSTVVKAVCKTESVHETKQKAEEDKRNSSAEEENASATVSLDSIEEPDVLECWEAETIEPVITPKRMLQSRGILCEGEAAEDDSYETDRVHLEHVQKYYRLARESATSIEGESCESRTNLNSSISKTVPNSPGEMIESFCSEEIPVTISPESAKANEDKKVPIDEAFEVYESCYTGKTPFLANDSKVFKSQALYGQDKEGPIPCRAVCCNIQ